MLGWQGKEMMNDRRKKEFIRALKSLLKILKQGLDLGE